MLVARKTGAAKAVISVSINPGWIVLTRISQGPSSGAAAFERPRRAHLLVVYPTGRADVDDGGVRGHQGREVLDAEERTGEGVTTWMRAMSSGRTSLTRAPGDFGVAARAMHLPVDVGALPRPPPEGPRGRQRHPSSRAAGAGPSAGRSAGSRTEGRRPGRHGCRGRRTRSSSRRSSSGWTAGSRRRSLRRKLTRSRCRAGAGAADSAKPDVGSGSVTRKTRLLQLLRPTAHEYRLLRGHRRSPEAAPANRSFCNPEPGKCRRTGRGSHRCSRQGFLPCSPRSPSPSRRPRPRRPSPHTVSGPCPSVAHSALGRRGPDGLPPLWRASTASTVAVVVTAATVGSPGSPRARSASGRLRSFLSAARPDPRQPSPGCRGFGREGILRG